MWSSYVDTSDIHMLSVAQCFKLGDAETVFIWDCHECSKPDISEWLRHTPILIFA